MGNLIIVTIIEGGNIASGSNVEVKDSSGNLVVQGSSNTQGVFETSLVSSGWYKAEATLTNIEGSFSGSKSFQFTMGIQSNETIILTKV